MKYNLFNHFFLLAISVVFLHIGNNAPVSKVEYLVQIYDYSLGQIPRSEISGTKVMQYFNALEMYCQLALQK